jgi:hypothetical protein
VDAGFFTGGLEAGAGDFGALTTAALAAPVAVFVALGAGVAALAAPAGVVVAVVGVAAGTVPEIGAATVPFDCATAAAVAATGAAETGAATVAVAGAQGAAATVLVASAGFFFFPKREVILETAEAALDAVDAAVFAAF